MRIKIDCETCTGHGMGMYGPESNCRSCGGAGYRETRTNDPDWIDHCEENNLDPETGESTFVFIDLDLSAYGFVVEDIQWGIYSQLTTEGNDIEELLDNASVSLTDQDGGEIDNHYICDTKYREELESLIRFEYIKEKGT